MLKKMNRLALYIAVTAPLLLLSQANAEQTAISELTSINLDAIATTETTAFDLSHSSTSADALLMPLNINTATQLELTALPGIGTYKAAQIIQWRDHHGEFLTTTDLVNVKGIGKGTITKLAGRITVTDL
ncbi:MAG: ComEA family DNA-binding protein [Moritella sp.]|uniref:ComEA family DNA-binding protein n=1 Tax=Moritella sp. TaxID=78556 RepID=UPI001D411BEF|nr:ComEA family DNA-binding protein [Moritella sp.]NQZ51888.1 ComEA family DNA-binding protein [Moritella sp.]